MVFPINKLLELEAIKMEAKGMEEENKSRLSQGYSASYDDRDFYKMAKKIRDLKDKISDYETELL